MDMDGWIWMDGWMDGLNAGFKKVSSGEADVVISSGLFDTTPRCNHALEGVGEEPANQVSVYVYKPDPEFNPDFAGKCMPYSRVVIRGLR